MKPPSRDKMDFEKVAVNKMIHGVIEKCQYDEKHVFKGFEGKPDTTGTAIRFKLKLDDYKFPHYSRWMRLSLGEKTTLYSKYVSKLVTGAEPDMDLDLDVLEGLEINVIYVNGKGDFQNLENIFPAGELADPNKPLDNTEHDIVGPEGEDAPF